jgi:signal transduction histidine kinase
VITGVLEVFNKRGGAFTELDEFILAEAADIISVAFEKARLTRDLQDLYTADRAKSKFVSMLVHEIVSPLATVYTCVSALERLRETLSPTDGRALAQGALSKVLSVQELAKDLLELLAVENGHALAGVEEVNVSDIIAAEAANHATAAEARGMRIVLVLPREPVIVRADPEGISLIFRHLIDNAVKYADAGTSVTVEGRVKNGSFEGTVRDCGPGISPECLSRVFDEFFRCAGAVRKSIPGSGLGLALVKALSLRYGGTVTARSSPGEGAVFTVALPCA